MEIERLKCKRCGKFPDGEVVQCTAKEHLVCVSCMVSGEKTLCGCGATLSEKRQRNPIEQLLQHAKTSCRYEENGCTWQFTATEMDSHVQECKFRPYRCITSTLNVRKCDWIGLQHEIEKHLLEEHKELGPVFRFRESSSLVFRDSISIGGLKLVDAFSKHFLFYFFSDVDRATISFLMIYFGRHEESDQYCYELEIRSLPMAPPSGVEQSTTPSKDAPSGHAAEDHRPAAMVKSVKFVERCYSDSENLTEVIEDERCIALSHQQVRNYLHKGKLYFNFKVRKVFEPARERSSSESADISGAMAAVTNATGTKPKPKPPPFVFANKGKVASNTKRSGGPAVATGAASSGSSKSGSAGSGGGDGASRSSSSPGSTLPSPSPSVSRPPSYASTVNVGSPGQELTASSQISSSSRNSGCSSYSSINKVVVVGLHSPFEKPENCPLMTPSINKHEVPPAWHQYHASNSTTYQITTQLQRSYSLNQEVYQDPIVTPCTRTLGTRVVENTRIIQPYKVKDDRGYIFGHPKNSLLKPQKR